MESFFAKTGRAGRPKMTSYLDRVMIRPSKFLLTLPKSLHLLDTLLQHSHHLTNRCRILVPQSWHKGHCLT